MISRIEGELVEVDDTRAHVRSGGLVYEVMIPAADRGRMTTAIGEVVTLHTLHLLEGTAQGTSFRPRLLGFATQSDRAFFELFTTVKGIGSRKALRVMELPVGRIALAVAEGDIALLKSLPEVGKRTAETIIMELKEKVAPFADPSASSTTEGAAVHDAVAAFAQEAIAVLLQLGEPRVRAEELVDRVTRADRTIDTADGLVTAALRLKQVS
jgi:Holliday junction DNA helicase RuvA